MPGILYFLLQSDLEEFSISPTIGSPWAQMGASPGEVALFR